MGGMVGEPMTETTLRDLFVSYGHESYVPPRGQQAQLLLGLIGVYVRHGLLGAGDPEPLCRVCPNQAVCWATLPEARRDGPYDNGSVCLPWVGPTYAPGGVAVIGINPNFAAGDYTDFLAEHSISYGQHIASLSAGHEKNGGSRFAYGSMRAAAALLDLLDGHPVLDRRPSQLADAVLRTARLQAVKCIPVRPGSTPAPEMWRRCPPMLLADKLDVLRPAHLLVLGSSETMWAVQMLPGYTAVPCRADRLSRGKLHGAGWEAEVYGVDHPAAWGYADASERSLISHLQRRSRRL
jgi:hypothetical protein